MHRNAQVLTLLVFVLVTSGCMNGGGETESEGSQAINVQELTVNPSQIHSGSSTNVILHISNGGELPANLTVNSDYEPPSQNEQESCNQYLGSPTDITPGDLNAYYNCISKERESSEDSDRPEGWPYADNILTDRCRDFLEVEDFNIVGPGDLQNSKYVLPAREEVRFTWSLRNPESSNVPLNGYDCGLKFQVPFDYDVNAYRQLQFKESRETTGAENLESRSSQGPMMLNIELIGSTADEASTFIEGDNAEAKITLVNQAEEGTSYTGFIDAEVPEIEVNAAGFSLEDGCGDIDKDSLTMYEGESQSIRCDLIVDGEIDGSTRGEITATTSYEYVQNLGTRNVELQYRGN